MADILRKGIFSWLAAVLVEYIILPGRLRTLSELDGLAEMSLIRIILLTGVFFLILTAVSRFVNISAAERTGIFTAFAALSALALYSSFTLPFFAVCILACIAMIIYALFGWNSSAEKAITEQKEHRIFLLLTAGITAFFFIFLSVCTVSRFYSFSTPTYDFGIFAQMFHHMKESGLPLTTVERDGLLSHFHVHMSPIFYLLLPFYIIAPFPATLQVLQAALMSLAVIPLWKIAKTHGLSDVSRMLVCGVFLFMPMLGGAATHDIHENCFLPFLILWLFYGIEKKNIPLIAIFSVLTLTVKEDAAVYVAVIALWLIFKGLLRYKTDKASSRFDLICGSAMLLAAIVYFLAVTAFLANVGEGVMTYRYRNFMYDGSSSLVTVIKSVILNPLKALFECVDAEKLGFIGLTLLPLLGLPLITRRYERYILLIPYILVNLMSDYVYQHDIYFQYTFGPTAFLIYLTVVNAADIKPSFIRAGALAAAFCIGICCFVPTVGQKLVKYPGYCEKYAELYDSIREKLDLIPPDASVTSTTFYMPYLSQRDTIYDIYYASKEHMLESEYVVLNVTANSEFRKYSEPGMQNGFEKIVELLTENGYELYAELDKMLVIYKQP